ncbi:MAG: CarD family transcriptional regulator [Clostridia bacterium]|nr:CarD family transcriptional regulator [Clostridia bacterium]
MFNIGDRVVYPMHGAGVIESIEEREILGQKQKYYIMKMPVGDIQVMVPTNNAQEVGMREVIQCKDADRVLNVLSGERTEMNANWNKRYRENMDKIKSGNIFEVAEVVKNLAYKNNEKGLSAGEKKLYNSAKQILISELVLANQASKDEIESLVEEKLSLHEAN